MAKVCEVKKQCNEWGRGEHDKNEGGGGEEFGQRRTKWAKR